MLASCQICLLVSLAYVLCSLTPARQFIRSIRFVQKSSKLSKVQCSDVGYRAAPPRRCRHVPYEASKASTPSAAVSGMAKELTAGEEPSPERRAE